MPEAKWLLFERSPIIEDRKTKIWFVLAKKDRAMLGRVEWDRSWRKYVFWPSESCVFEQDCLRDIANFIEAATRDHYAALKAAKMSAV